MCKYKKGDVVWGLCLFSDRSGQKSRPCIILRLDEKDCRYFIMECSTLKDRHAGGKGIVIKEAHSEFLALGFEEDTFINLETKGWLPEKFLKPPPTKADNPIGVCSFMDKLE